MMGGKGGCIEEKGVLIIVFASGAYDGAGGESFRPCGVEAMRE